MASNHGGAAWGGGYGLGFIGALIYFLQHAHSFWSGLVGIVEALFWPAVLIYHLFAFLKV
jgi:hypothetical protein